MHRALPHPIHIDGFRFAQSCGRIEGEVRLVDLPRLQDVLSSPAGSLRYKLDGTQDDMGRLALRIRAEGSLGLTCQRCLGPLELPVLLDNLLVLARSEREIEGGSDDPEGPDRLVANEAMPVLEMLEDELLLAIPYVPRHEACTSELAEPGASAPSAFQGLRGLLGGSGGSAKSN